MGTSTQFLSQVINQVERATELGAVTAQPIFGEYCLCLGGRGIAIVCEDTVYIKRLPAIETTMVASGGQTALPFAGARPHWILNVGNHDLLGEVLPELYAAAIPPTDSPVEDLPGVLTEGLTVAELSFQGAQVRYRGEVFLFTYYGEPKQPCLQVTHPAQRELPFVTDMSGYPNEFFIFLRELSAQEWARITLL